LQRNVVQYNSTIEIVFLATATTQRELKSQHSVQVNASKRSIRFVRKHLKS